MYLTAVDLSWEENVPVQTPTRKKTGGGTLAWSFRPSSGSQCPLPCPGTCKARAWGQIWPASGNTDKPSPGSEPLPQVKRTEGQAAGTGTSTLALTRSLGSLRTLLCFGDPFHVLHGQLTPGALPGRFRSLGSLRRLSPASEMRRRPPPDALAERGETPVEEEQPGDARRLREGPLASAACPLPLPGAAQGPEVLRPLKPLALSPRRPGSVCVSGCPPLPLRPFRGTESQGRVHVPAMEAENRESVLYTVLI